VAPPASSSDPAIPPAAVAKTSVIPWPPPTHGTQRSPSTIKLLPNQIAFNPNAALTDRPVVALTTAILLNVIVDYDLVSDHARDGCALGVLSGSSRGGGGRGGEVCADLAMARYIARTSSTGGQGLLWTSSESWVVEAAMIDQWIDYASSLLRFGLARRALAVQRTLDPVLRSTTYVAGHTMTLADVALFASLGFPSSDEMKGTIASFLPKGCPTLRWMDTIASHPAIREATQLAMGISGRDEVVFESNTILEPIMTGMNYLEGATPGNVTVRFPPEPSGYLHVGHAKAVLLSDYYARRYGGRLILRFDDTNPSKEKDEYQSSIVEDLAKIGVRPDVVTFTSDYFGTIEKYALWMIANGHAYMDDTPQETMQKERMDRQNSKHRDQSPATALECFKLMKSGSEKGEVWCLRAKMDMSSDNGTLRDPVLYRQNTTPHHRSGTTYKAYPTYDLACPIVDSIEGVTHALRTTEYDDRNAQFAWIQRVLGLHRVRIQTFARMNFMYTVMSKRKLTWFVETGKVTGWDDPRFPTVRGVTRRGIDVDALKRFMCSQGASRRVVNMEWNKFWAENKKNIDLYAKRFMAVDKVEHVVLTVTNAGGGDSIEFLSTEYLPKDPSFGMRLVRIGKKVLLEKVDTEGM
jgi:glutamyl/glutaminyl-tRNA synthetase